MKQEKITVLERTQIKKDAAITGCCGGAPVANRNACCKLDEDKKAEGESGCGCGCNTTQNIKSGPGYC